MIRPDESCGRLSFFLRDDRAVPVYDAGRLVALALAAAVAAAGGAEHATVSPSSPSERIRCSVVIAVGMRKHGLKEQSAG